MIVMNIMCVETELGSMRNVVDSNIYVTIYAHAPFDVRSI